MSEALGTTGKKELHHAKPNHATISTIQGQGNVLKHWSEKRTTEGEHSQQTINYVVPAGASVDEVLLVL